MTVEKNIFLKLFLISIVFISGCISSGQINEHSNKEYILTEFDKWLFKLAEIEGVYNLYNSEKLKDCDSGIDKSSCAEFVGAAVRFFARGCYYGETDSCAHLAAMDRKGQISNDKDGKHYRNIANFACPDPENSGCVNLGWYLYGIGEIEEAKLYNKAACITGEGAGCYNLAWLNLRENPAEGEKYLKLACLFDFDGGCIDFGIRSYNAGFKEIGKDYVHYGYETADQYCGKNGDAETCHSIALWNSISGESDNSAVLMNNVKVMIKNVYDHGATEKIIKFREDNPQLFTGTAKNYSNGRFKEGEIYKGYYFCEQVPTEVEIEIKNTEDNNTKAVVKLRDKFIEEYDTSGFNDSFPEIYKFTPIKGSGSSEDYELPGFSGFLDAETGEFYGKVEGETCGLFLTAEIQTGKNPSYQEIESLFRTEYGLSTFRKIECNLGNGTREDLILKKFGEKGLKIYKLIDGVRNLEQIMNETGVDADFILEINEYFERCGWIILTNINT